MMAMRIKSNVDDDWRDKQLNLKLALFNGDDVRDKGIISQCDCIKWR